VDRARGPRGPRRRASIRWAAAAIVAGVLLSLASRLHAGQAAPASPPLTVKITSPLGRIGASVTVRIVAQVRVADERAFPKVSFFVDDKLIKVDDDGPPYATDWVDDNPLEERKITVEAVDAAGHTAKDVITLNAYELNDSTQVSSVVLEASVYTKSGHYVTGLKPEDFALRENGTPQVLGLLSAETIPATFALLIDSSQSMAPHVDFVRLAARRLAKYLRPLDRVIVAPFSVGLGPLTGPTNDQPTVLESISAIRPGGGTAILDALSDMAGRMSGIEGRRAIVLLTDGFDENSVRTFDETLKALQTAQTTVYVVGIGGISGVSLKGQTLLRRLAADTGGKVFFPWRDEELAAAYDLVATDAQNRYLLAYTPSDDNADGTWRAIEVTTSTGDVVVQTRAGYFAPKPPPVRPELEFTLTDAAQQPVDVTMDELMVLEDGLEQKIDSFHEVVAPVSVVLALDASGSMRRSEEAVVDAARGFVETLRPKDALAVMMFADQATFAHDLSTTRDESLRAIEAYTAAGGTALYDALDGALFRLSRIEGRRAIVVVTDGRDENNPGTGPGSAHTFDQVLQRLKGSKTLVFAVGIGSRVDRQPLEQVAKLSGGAAYFPSDVSTLAEEYQHIVDNLRRRFVLSYASTNTARDGSWRKVEIRVRSSNLLVSSAGGYFAPDR
jgi:Ca-activated chloride channel family protein